MNCPIAVVFYSGSGNTHMAARAVSENLGSNTEETLDTENRSGLTGWMRDGMCAASRKHVLLSIENLLILRVTK